MNKKGKHWLLIMGIIGSILILSVVLFTTLGSGMNKNTAKEYIDADWSEKTSTQDGQPSYLALLDQRSAYTINSISKEETYYVVSVTVSAPDVKQYLFDNSVHKLDNIDDFDAFLCDCVESSNITETVAEIYIYEIDGETRISYSEEFADAMHGKLISYSQELLEELYVDSFTEGSESGE